MTIVKNPGDVPNVQPVQPRQQARGPWIQIAIVLVSAIVLGGSSCAVMAASYSIHQTLFGIAMVGFLIGVAAIPVTFVWTIVALILRLVRKRKVSA